MTANDFRKLALALPETEERAAHGPPRLPRRRKNLRHARLSRQDLGMVKLSPEDQHYFTKDHPEIFVPVKGAWGRRGATFIHLKLVKKEILRKALQAAWSNTAPKRLVG